MKQFLFCLTLLFICQNSKAQHKDFYISGSLNFSTGFNSIDGIEPRKPGSFYTISGSPTIHIKGIDLPFFFIFSNYQKDFRQPFNQFGISPEIKGVKLHLGHRYLNWSQYSLGGHRFFGLGAEAQFGILRVGAMSGKFLNAIPKDTTSVSTFRPTYARSGKSFRLGLGSKNSFLDFIYFEAGDKISSLTENEANNTIKPAQNNVIGINSQWLITQKLTFKLEAGVSGLTRDIRAQEIELDSTNGLVNFGKKIFTPRISSQINTGGEVSLAFKESSFGLDVKYKRIDPGYTTFGSYYFRNDIRQLTFGLFLNLLQSKFLINGRLGLENDNIKEQKAVTTNRKVFSAFSNIRMSNSFSVNVQFSNFGIAQEGVQVSISDTTRLDNISRSFVVNPNLNLNNKRFNHNINLVYSNQKLNDKNRFTKLYSEVSTLNISVNYNLGFNKSGLSFSAGANQTSTEVLAGKSQSFGGTLGIAQNFKKQGLSLGANYFYNKNKFEDSDNGSTNRISAFANLNIRGGHGLKFQFYRMKNETKNNIFSNSFSEINAQLQYSYRFNTQKRKS